MNLLSTKEIIKRSEHLALLENQKNYRNTCASFIKLHLLRNKAISNGASPTGVPIVSMLVVAGSGSGKSYVTKQVAKAAGVHVITVDCSSLSREGWKGGNLGDILLNESRSQRNNEKFETSIIHFDEFDKLRHWNNYNDQGNAQVNLLRIFDGEILATPHGSETVTINTSRMSFIFSGAFAGLEEIVKKRITPPRRVGFSIDDLPAEEPDYYSLVNAGDLQSYGIMKELVGRIGYVTHIPDLSVEDYRVLIKGENGSSKELYNNLYRTMGVSVDITDAACEEISKLSLGSGLGARAVNHSIFGEFSNALLAIEEDTGINKVTLDCSAEGELFLTYGFGPRELRSGDGFSLYRRDPISLYKVLNGPRGVKRSVRKIMKVFSQTNLPGYHVLESFIKCSLMYLKYNCNADDQIFESLLKLAKTDSLSPGETSTYDNIISNGIKNMPDNEEMKMAYHALCISRRIDSYPEIIIAALTELSEKCYYRLSNEFVNDAKTAGD